MSRLVPSLAVAFAALTVAAPALAADYGDDFGDMRTGYPDDWEMTDEGDPLGFEVGLRYWYSWGSDSWQIAGEDLTSTDNTQFGEAYLRIDDYSTLSYLKGIAGYGFASATEVSSPFGTENLTGGEIGYAGADFGWNPFGMPGEDSGFYGFAGYQFWKESPNMGRRNFTTAESAEDITWSPGASGPSYPGDSEPNNIDVHALRLGISGRYEFNDFIDITGEVAAVPYAWVNGTLGAHAIPDQFSPGNYLVTQASATSVSGWGYGGMAELMVGIHPHENMLLRLGGRAWYLQGNVDATFSRAVITAPTGGGDPGFTKANYISTSNPFSFFRYGLLAELTYSF